VLEAIICFAGKVASAEGIEDEERKLQMRRFRLVLASVLLSMILIGCVVVLLAWPRVRLMGVNTRERAEFEHGIVLPASAGGFQCRGDALRGFLDRGASTVFVMDAGDVPALKSRVRMGSHLISDIPGNDVYRAGIIFPWKAGTGPLEAWDCDSPTGDWLRVEIRPVATGRVGVWMYTDWN
jgi:hypothetical protein